MIPRLDLTVASTDLLSETLFRVLIEMLKTSCPCHYPRYRELTSFLHDNYKAGPVFCADTNYLISGATRKELNYLKEIRRIKDRNLGDYADIIYECNKCSTVYRNVTRQYSINFEFSYLLIEQARFGKDIGSKLKKPIPLLQGLFGFNDKDILKCATDFILADADEVYNYLTETI